MTILEETLVDLRSAGELDGRAIRSVYPTPYFAILELDDGSVGAGMGYYRCKTDQSPPLREQIESFTKSDSLLLEWLFETPQPWLRVGREGEDGRRLIMSLQTALLSALSSRRLQAGGSGFAASSSLAPNVLNGATRALVIGFGGYMKHFASHEQFDRLHVCDLDYRNRPEMMEEWADQYRAKRPALRFTLSDGQDAESRMRDSDVVTITGSTLCNGTLEDLLRMSEGGPRVIVQGQSAAILPAAMFRRGVALLATTVKPPELARLAEEDPSGDKLKPMLEGGIPWMYFVPR